MTGLNLSHGNHRAREPAQGGQSLMEKLDDKSALMKSHITSQDVKDEVLKLPEPLRNLLAGGVAGMVAKSIVAPVDRIKILYQVSSARFSLADVPRVARTIMKEEGVAALWKGNVATMIRVFPYAGVQFMVFDKCKSTILRRAEERNRVNGETSKEVGLTPLESLLAGSVAGATSVVATYPLDLTRAQLAILKRKRNEKNMGFVGVMSKNFRDQGINGLFRGVTPTLLGILPYAGIAFSLNEQSKRRIQSLTGRDVTTAEKMLCGALSGLVAQTLTYPLDVTRRRMQAMGVGTQDVSMQSLGVNKPNLNRRSNMLVIMRQLFQEQGLHGFFKGVTMNWIKGPIAISISFTMYDIVQESLKQGGSVLHHD